MKKVNKNIKVNKLIWVVNLIMFVSVVYLGIEQGSKGADIAKLESDIENQISAKRDLTEQIFTHDQGDNQVNLADLGFVKPSKILYFDTEEATAKLPVR